MLAFTVYYFYVAWNLFDLLYAMPVAHSVCSLSRVKFMTYYGLESIYYYMCSTVAAGLVSVFSSGVSGLSVIRAFRLLRVFRCSQLPSNLKFNYSKCWRAKCSHAVFTRTCRITTHRLAQRWDSMRELLHVLFRTLWSLFYITLVLALTVLIFAIIGLQLFSSSYVPHRSASTLSRISNSSFRIEGAVYSENIYFKVLNCAVQYITHVLDWRLASVCRSRPTSSRRIRCRGTPSSPLLLCSTTSSSVPFLSVAFPLSLSLSLSSWSFSSRRWNFVDIWHSLLVVFRCLRESCFDTAYECQRAAGGLCWPFYIATWIVCYFLVRVRTLFTLTFHYISAHISSVPQVLNIFLALMIEAFTRSTSKRRDGAVSAGGSSRFWLALDKLRTRWLSRNARNGNRVAPDADAEGGGAHEPPLAQSDVEHSAPATGQLTEAPPPLPLPPNETISQAAAASSESGPSAAASADVNGTQPTGPRSGENVDEAHACDKENAEKTSPVVAVEQWPATEKSTSACEEAAVAGAASASRRDATNIAASSEQCTHMLQ